MKRLLILSALLAGCGTEKTNTVDDGGPAVKQEEQAAEPIQIAGINLTFPVPVPPVVPPVEPPLVVIYADCEDDARWTWSFGNEQHHKRDHDGRGLKVCWDKHKNNHDDETYCIGDN